MTKHIAQRTETIREDIALIAGITLNVFDRKSDTSRLPVLPEGDVNQPLIFVENRAVRKELFTKHQRRSLCHDFDWRRCRWSGGGGRRRACRCCCWSKLGSWAWRRSGHYHWAFYRVERRSDEMWRNVRQRRTNELQKIFGPYIDEVKLVPSITWRIGSRPPGINADRL